MKKLAALLFVLFATLGQAQTQAPTRVLVLPFDASSSFEPYGLGLATGLQRVLNSFDGIYSPPVAEGGLFVTRAHEAGLDPIGTATEVFEADMVVSGGVSGQGSTLAVTLLFSGPLLGEEREITFRVAGEPATAVAEVSLATLEQLGRRDAASEEKVQRLAEESPELTSLAAVARASSRLGANVSDLRSAADLNPESSWVLSETARSLALAGRLEQALEFAGRAVEMNSEDADAAVVLGIVADEAGQDDRARGSFEAALALNSEHALALVGLAGLTQDRAAARDLLQQAVTAAPRQVEAVLRLAELEPSHQRALQSLRRASANLPESVALHRAFVQRAIAAGDPAGALSYLKSVVNKPLSTSPALYAQVAALPTEFAEEGLALLREGREKFPDSSGLQLTEADVLRTAGRNEEAVALLEDLYSRYPDSVEVANSLAVALADAGEIERAREVFTEAADDSPVAQLNLGRLLLREGLARAAVETVEPLVEGGGNDAEAFTIYGIGLGRIGRIDDAIAALDRALELDPDSQQAARARALLEQQRGIVGDDAVAFEGEAASAFERGLLELETGAFAQAAASFARVQELDDHPLAAFYRGYALHRSGETRDAVPLYRTALDAYPNSDTVLNNLGYAQLQLGRLDLALELLRRAAAANEQNASVHVNLGLTFFGLGRYTEALEAWDRAVAIDPALEDDLADVRSRAEERR